MIEIEYSRHFLRKTRKLIRKDQGLKGKIVKKIDQFQVDPGYPGLRTHKLENVDAFSFWIEGDLRIIYRWEEGVAVFINIGSHDQVYR